jgi:GMP synthase-like glutamine amidotransferase
MREWPLIGFGLGAQIVALAAGGRSESAPLQFELGVASRTHAQALNGYLPAMFPYALYMRDWPLPPDYAQVHARDAAGRAMVWQIGARAFGFVAHPGLKVAMVEDLIMEFEESPAQPEAGLVELRRTQRALEDALVPIMTGLVQCTGWMDAAVSRVGV